MPAGIPPGYTPYQPGMLIGRGAERLAGLARAIQILLVIVLVLNAISAVDDHRLSLAVRRLR